LPTLLCLALAAVAVYPLTLATRTIPVGTAYAMFTGIGAVGAIAFGVLVNHDPLTAGRLGALALIVAGLVLARLSADEWESLQETLFWLSQPGIHESLAEAEADIIAGRTYNEDQVRQSLGLPAKR